LTNDSENGPELVVYFDTSFWVRLREASEDVARAAVNALNELRVRYVLSRLHIIELLGFKGDGLGVLADRAAWFALEPLQLDEAAGFEALRAPRDQRMTEMEEVESLSTDMARAASFALSARRSSEDHDRLKAIGVAATPEQAREVDAIKRRQAELMEASLQGFRSLGLVDANGGLDLGKMLANLGLPEFGKHGTVNLENPAVPTPERQKQMLEISRQIMTSVSDEQRGWVEERYALEDAAFNGDERPRELIMGRATPQDAHQVRNTGRDAEHMQNFLLHEAEIDLLQLDNEQNVAMRTNENHPINKRGLAARCFNAGTLDKVVSVVAKMRDRGRPGDE